MTSHRRRTLLAGAASAAALLLASSAGGRRRQGDGEGAGTGRTSARDGAAGTATWYVSTTGSDANVGSISAPFATIRAAAAAVARQAAPGAIVQVAPGTYIGGFTLTCAGTGSAPILFISTVKWGARIVPPVRNASGLRFGWENRGDFVTIDGFEIDGTVESATGLQWNVGVGCYGMGNTVRNCHVHHIALSDTTPATGGAGVLMDSWYGRQNMTADANVCHHIGPPTSSQTTYHGIYQSAAGSISNNVSYANSGGGVHCWHDARSIVIVNNTCFNNVYGVIYGGGDYLNLAAPADYITIRNNLLAHNGIGVHELGDVGTHCVVDYNLCYANATAYSLNVSRATHNIAGDPLFVNYQADGSGDYHLKAGSPAIRAGTRLLAPALDLNGATRSLLVDVGAYRYDPGATGGIGAQ